MAVFWNFMEYFVRHPRTSGLTDHSCLALGKHKIECLCPNLGTADSMYAKYRGFFFSFSHWKGHNWQTLVAVYLAICCFNLTLSTEFCICHSVPCVPDLNVYASFCVCAILK